MAWTKTLPLIAIVAFFLIATTAQAGNGLTPIPTNRWHDFYGYINGANLGDVITAEDPDGVICGEYIVEMAGQYGFMHVYADDPYTSGVDEGAQYGDTLTFYYNGSRMVEDATWLGGRAITLLNLTIYLEGDVNGDCIVNITDLAAVGLAYGSRPGDSNWNPDADVVENGLINIFDLATVGLNYGRSC